MKRSVLWFRGLKYAEELTQQLGVEEAEKEIDSKSLEEFRNDFDKGCDDYFRYYRDNIK